MIVSEVDGRIRIRAKRLKSSKIANSIKGKVEELEGVHTVRVNPEASSIVVNFDVSVVDTFDLEDQIIEICTPTNGDKTKHKTLSKRVNQATKIGMMTTLATSLAYGFMGQKKNHILFGKAFVAFAGAHMLKHSGRLLK
jgi:copper chaperone CopZ